MPCARFVRHGCPSPGPCSRAWRASSRVVHRITQLLRLPARQRCQPGFRFQRDRRLPAGARAIVQRGHRAFGHRPLDAALHRPPTGQKGHRSVAPLLHPTINAKSATKTTTPNAQATRKDRSIPQQHGQPVRVRSRAETRHHLLWLSRHAHHKTSKACDEARGTEARLSGRSGPMPQMRNAAPSIEVTHAPCPGKAYAVAGFSQLRGARFQNKARNRPRLRPE